MSDHLNSDELLLPGHLQLFESHHLISMVSKLHRERQNGICYCLSENAHSELALELGIELSVSHFFGADPGVLFLFLSHHLYIFKIERIQSADDLKAIPGVSDGTAGGGLVDSHARYARCTGKGIFENFRLFIGQLSAADPDSDPVFCLCVKLT